MTPRRLAPCYGAPMQSAPIILVPGFWLGAWAWEEVVEALRNRGHDVTAMTLPGLESPDADRSAISLSDHVDAICNEVAAAERPVVLVVHSGAGVPGYQVTDRMPERIATMVYVDSGPATGALDPDFEGVDQPLPSSEELAEQNVDGLTDEHLARFRQRAVPQPGAALRDAPSLANPARRDVPTTVVGTSFTSAQFREAAEQGYSFLGGLTELTNVTYIDLPTGHWPMWSRPDDLADILGDVATAAGGTAG